MIKSVVAMVPHQINWKEWFYIAEKPDLDVVDMRGYSNIPEDVDEEDFYWF